ncbi:hypothetical protein NDU88_001658 [Pleurodeles waltl]|uniref:Uncharacterized protein n=1 Tax=Pleurodeles waltl TaxID=8319 RepID=A0AAV7NBD8_PLEWA|nr:hypothetical protein NDU88_001658 [Pleurodeles waltl]
MLFRAARPIKPLILKVVAGCTGGIDKQCRHYRQEHPCQASARVGSGYYDVGALLRQVQNIRRGSELVHMFGASVELKLRVSEVPLQVQSTRTGAELL